MLSNVVLGAFMIAIVIMFLSITAFAGMCLGLWIGGDYGGIVGVTLGFFVPIVLAMWSEA